MKTKVLMALIFVLSSPILAQKLPKIKGNREVVTQTYSLDQFNEIEVQNGLNVDLVQSTELGYQLTADENLVDIVKLKVIDGRLKIYTINKVTSCKKLEIKVNFIDLQAIRLTDDANITSIGKIELNNLECILSEGSSLNLDLEANKTEFVVGKDTDISLKLRGKKTKFIMQENANISGSLATDEAVFELVKRAKVKFSGTVESLSLTAVANTSADLRKLIAKDAQINCDNSADVHVYANKTLQLYAQGNSYIYVYGNPDIKIDGLNDSSQIIKK